MEAGNSMTGGLIPGGMGAGVLGLEMPLHPQPHNHHQLLHHQHRLLPFSAHPHDADSHPHQQPIRNACAPYGGRGKQQVSLSPEEDPGFGGDDAGFAVDGPKRGAPQAAPSPWQRMKWTDTMVRLLITVVYCVGDEGGGAGAEGGDHHPSSGKANNNNNNNNNNNAKKVGSAQQQQQQQQQQKKGKWKSVSRAMMERGYYVSPQQCEDKFNDLNKRYKRVNELLGRGTACRVVENQALLESIDLSPKAKEEARKLLNSKHLFFREMCAYHNSYSSCAPSLPPPPPPHPPSDQLQSQHQKLHCLHQPPGDGGVVDGEEDHPDDDEVDMEHEDDEDDDYENEDDVDDVEEDEDHDNKHGQQHHRHHQRNRHEEGDEDEDSKGFMAAATSNAWSTGVKRPRKESLPSSASPPLSLSLSSPPSSASMQQLRCELMGMAAGGEEQQRQWLRRRGSELEEQRVGYQRRALELERQRFKWLRFSGNKEREMERMKLDNERLRLENERMLLLLRQKELELISCGEGASSAAPAADTLHQQQ